MSGYSSGSCYGSGYGSGYGDGDGYGDGYGYGYGSGSGSGYGYGYGYSYGYGYGDGDGYGDGYWEAIKDQALNSIAERPRGPVMFWWSDADGQPCNNGRPGPAAAPGLEQSVTLAVLCDCGFHATNRPERWKGQRLWLVELGPDAVGDDTKMVSTYRKILCELK
jgi:hypothetical protein